MRLVAQGVTRWAVVHTGATYSWVVWVGEEEDMSGRGYETSLEAATQHVAELLTKLVEESQC